MKVTLPQMGNVYIAFKALMEGLDIDYVIPPITNKAALELGTLHSPEEICYPFKINIGNYIQSINMGADTVIITGSCGPCRFGEYCELQMNILSKIGHDIDFIVIDSPKEITFKVFKERLMKIANASKLKGFEKIMALKDSYRVIKLIDDLEAKVHEKAGYEVNKGECKRLLYECKREAMKVKGSKEIIRVIQSYREKLKEIEIDRDKKPIKIGIIGEIYTIIEPYSNLFIENKLMDYGVSSFRKLTPTWWVSNIVLTPVKLDELDIKRASRKYLPLCIGGHARECIGEAVIAAKNGMDGLIQVFPMGCMPEIVAKSILPRISKDYNIPILTLIVDEMTGEAGYDTRIEAFLDLIERRRLNVLFGS